MKKIDKCKLYHGDCLKIMKKIKDSSINLILCDLPYGTTPCEWDKVIDFKNLWKQYLRVIREDGAIVLFATQPFTSKLILSNIDYFKYCWVWVKDNSANFLVKKYQPGKLTEDICVFGKGATSYSKGNVNMKYNPQLEIGKPYKCTNGNKDVGPTIRSKPKQIMTENNGTRLPNNVIYFNKDASNYHPTQKPIKLLEYLIKTYSDKGDLVLDNTMGSGSTGVACQNLGRKFIGIEKDKKYFKIACDRIKSNKGLF